MVAVSHAHSQRLQNVAIGLAILAVAAAALGAAERPRLALAAVAAGGLVICTLRVPVLAVLGFGAAAVFSEWFFVGHAEGLLPGPSQMLSPPIWSLLMWLIALVLRIRNPGIQFPAGPLHRWIWIYAGAVGLSVVNATYRAQSLHGATAGLKALVVTVSPIPIAYILQQGHVHSSRRIVLVTSLLLGIFGVLQWRTGLTYRTAESWLTLGATGRWWSLDAVYGPFATTGKNDFGDLLVLMCAILLPQVIYADISRRARLALVAVCATCTGLVVLSTARQALVSLVAVLAIVLATKRARFLALVAACATASVLFVPAVAHTALQTRDRGFTGQSVGDRNAVSRQLLEGADLRWVPGTGYGNVGQETARIGVGFEVSYAGDQTIGATPDNLYLRQLVELGLAGLLSLIGLLVAGFYSSFASASGASLPWRMALRAMIVGTAVQGLFNDTFYSSAYLGTWALLMGCCLAEFGTGKQRSAAEGPSEDA